MHHPEWEFTFGGIYNSSGNTAGMAAITAWKENAVDGDYAGALSLQTTPNGGAPTEKVRIASNGNVGVGISAPNYLMQIHRSGASSAAYTQYTNGSTGSALTDGALIGVDSANDAILWMQEAASLKLATNNTERMRIDSSGKVGIGTTSPDRTLHVAAATSAPQVHIARTDVSPVNIWIGGSNQYAGFASDQPIQFRVASTNGSDGTSGIFIANSGNVGVGTTSPTSLLHVNGSAAAVSVLVKNNQASSMAQFTASNASQSFAMRIDTDDKFKIRDVTNTTDRLTIDTSGNVGIGTTAPGAPLQIGNAAGSNIKFNQDSAGLTDINWIGDPRIRFTTNSSGTFGSSSDPSAGAGGIRLGNSSGYSYIVGGTNLLLNPVSGNVGIGTTNPKEALDLGDSAPSITMGSNSALMGNLYYGTGWKYRADGYGGYIKFNHHTTNGGGIDIGLTSVNNASGEATVASPLPVMTILPSGNVGIGTTSPLAAIDISKTDGVELLRMAATSSPALYHLKLTGVSNITGDYRFQTVNGGTSYDVLYLKGTGNVGVGTIAPASPLSVAAGANDPVKYSQGIQIIGSPSTGQLLSLIRNGNAVRSIGYLPNSNTFGIGGGNTTDSSFTPNLLAIDISGNVGVGTTSPLSAANMQLSSTAFTDAFLSVEQPASASKAENIATFKVSDSANYFRIGNTITTDNRFAASITYRNLDSNPSSFVIGSEMLAAGDTGIEPAVRIVGFTRDASQNFAALATRPVLDVRNNATTLLHVAASGNVGIGTAAPAQKLSVAGTLGIGEAGSSGGRLLLSSSATGGVINQQDNSPLFFQTQAVTKMTILDNGNVGVGTTNSISCFAKVSLF